MSENLDIRDYNQFDNAIELAKRTVYKRYLPELESSSLLNPTPILLDEQPYKCLRFFQLLEFSCKKGEDIFQKLSTVYHATMSQGCNLAIILDVESIGAPVKIYIGVRSEDDNNIENQLIPSFITLKNGIESNFPGTKLKDVPSQENLTNLLDDVFNNHVNYISSVSCVASSRDKSHTENKLFIQGLERFIDVMGGNTYTALFIADPIPKSELIDIRNGYENLYTQLSSFNKDSWSYNENDSKSVMESFSDAVSKSISNGISNAKSHAVNIGVPHKIGASYSNSTTKTYSETDASTHTNTEGTTDTKGTGKTIQIETINKSIDEMLKRIEMQLKRTQEGEDYGAYNCAAYFLSSKKDSNILAANTYRALMLGEGSSVESGAINNWSVSENPDDIENLKKYLKRFVHPIFESNISDANGIEMPKIKYTPGSLVSGLELPIHLGLPTKSVYGMPVIEHAEFGRNITDKGSFGSQDNRRINIGKIYNMGKVEEQANVDLNIAGLTAHTFITGSTGSGKSNTIYQMLDNLNKEKINFLVVEPAKGEYKSAFAHRDDVTVYGTNNKIDNQEMLRINPFSFPENIHVLEHLDRLVEIFNVCWPMYAAMPAILKDSIHRAYEIAGWDMINSENKYDNNLFPTFVDVYKQIRKVLEESDYSQDNKGDYTGSLVTRLKSLTNGINGLIFTPDEISSHDLFDTNVIVDLSRIGSSETKSLIMGLLVLKLQEYRLNSPKANQELRHVTVLEEAHNLLRRTSTEQSSDSSNLLGKSVEMLANAIAEMRTYGEGFIIADQSPGLLDMSVIRNTNTKIIMRLPDYSDRELVGLAAGLNDEQIIELAKLDNGVAAIKQSEWLEAILCKVEKYEFTESSGPSIIKKQSNVDSKLLKDSLLECIMNKEIYRKGDRIDICKLREKIIKSNLDIVVKCKFMDYIIAEKNESFESLRKLLYDFLDAENAIEESVNFDDLSEWVNEVVDRLNPSIKKYSSHQIDLVNH